MRRGLTVAITSAAGLCALLMGALPSPAPALGVATGEPRAAAGRPIPQGLSYWHEGSRIRVVKRSGNSYWYALSGSDYSCEHGKISGLRTRYRWAEEVVGHAETGRATGRMWVAGGMLHYANSALNSYTLEPARATSATRRAGSRALAVCADKL